MKASERVKPLSAAQTLIVHRSYVSDGLYSRQKGDITCSSNQKLYERESEKRDTLFSSFRQVSSCQICETRGEEEPAELEFPQDTTRGSINDAVHLKTLRKRDRERERESERDKEGKGGKEKERKGEREKH